MTSYSAFFSLIILTLGPTLPLSLPAFMVLCNIQMTIGRTCHMPIHDMTFSPTMVTTLFQLGMPSDEANESPNLTEKCPQSDYHHSTFPQIPLNHLNRPPVFLLCIIHLHLTNSRSFFMMRSINNDALISILSL